MKAQGLDHTEENLDLNKKIARPLATEGDVQSRKEIAQSIIDRLIDRKFGKEYLHDLLKLNCRYSFQYEIKNGVRVYMNSALDKQIVSSLSGQALSKMSVDESGNFSYHKSEQTLSLPELDVQLRAQLVQDCLDRILNLEFGEEYQESLLHLHNQYHVEFEVRNGAHVYSTESAIDQELEKAADEFLIPSETSADSAKNSDSLMVLNKMIKEIGASKVAPNHSEITTESKQVAIQATEDVNIMDLLKPSYIVRRSKTINRKLKRDLVQSSLYHQIQELVEAAYRRLSDRKPETAPTVVLKQSPKVKA